MLYYSLNHQSPEVSFRTACIQGQAPDKGLYFPKSIPVISKEELKKIRQYSKEDMAYHIMQPYVGDDIPEDLLRTIAAGSIDFDFPLADIDHQIFSLELFHGPTFAFKDVGARFMSRCLSYFNRHTKQPVTVLVATSGDTGGAVANGFAQVKGVNVIILYPSGKVSPVQELQLTTCGGNITALEVKGTFDDCQSMVKNAFADADLNQKLLLTSANSINVARWLPQQLYYFLAFQQWAFDIPPVISVPSGNFGNICAGILAHISGLPVKHFIAACNANDIIPEYLQTGEYLPKPSVATLSNAMDVGNPSNFVRVMNLFHNHLPDLKNVLNAYSISDEVTLQTIKEVYQQYHYILDPHSAVGYRALKDYLGKDTENRGLLIATAHPAKFPDTVESATGTLPEMPVEALKLISKKKQSVLMEPDFISLKNWLMKML